MFRRSRSLALTLALGLSVFVASSAQAIPTDVEFDLTITINLPAFALSTFTGTGNMTVRFVNGQSTPNQHAGAGALRVMGGTASLLGSFTVLGDLFTGAQNALIPQNVGLGGGATLGGVFSLAAFGHITAGFIHCTGTTCALASLPASIPVPLTSSPFVMALNGIFGATGTGVGVSGTTGALMTFTGNGPAGTAFGQALTIQVTGVEVSRSHPVPEPTSGALLGLGLFSALGLGATRLRR